VNQFLTSLQLAKVSYDGSGRPIYELVEHLIYHSDRFGDHVMEKGRRTNLNSTPRFPVIYLAFGEEDEEACAIHDDKYTRHDVEKEVADLLFLEMMAAPKVVEVQKFTPAWKRRVKFEGVRLFGQSSWDAPNTVWQPQDRPTAGQLAIEAA
jgi:hypothetical protein